VRLGDGVLQVGGGSLILSIWYFLFNLGGESLHLYGGVSKAKARISGESSSIIGGVAIGGVGGV